MKRVGFTPVKKKDGKFRKFSYIDIAYDEDGWALASKYLPLPYDLMWLQLKDGTIKSGWVEGKVWEGVRLKPSDKVVKWRIYKENYGEDEK